VCLLTLPVDCKPVQHMGHVYASRHLMRCCQGVSAKPQSVSTHMHTYAYTYIHTYTHTHTHTHIQTHTYTYTHIHTYKHTHTHTHTYIRIRIQTHTHIHTYTHISTHKPRSSRLALSSGCLRSIECSHNSLSNALLPRAPTKG